MTSEVATVRVDKYSVDDLLDAVDYTFPGYVPSIEALDFVNFIRLVLGEEPENANSMAHYFMMDVIFKKVDPWAYYDIQSDIARENYFAVMCHREFSKALDINCKVITPNGYTIMGDLKVGDTVYDRNGIPTLIKSKSRTFLKPTFELILEDGRRLYMSEDHDNILWQRGNKRLGGRGSKRISGMREVVKTAREMYEEGVKWDRTVTDAQRKGSEYKYYVPAMTNPVEFPSVDFPLDPYTVGVILGDCNINNDTGHPRLTTHINDLEEYKANIPYKFGTSKPIDNTISIGILKINKEVKKFIGTANSYTKKVPEILKVGSVEQRLAVLQGLMDTDGTISTKGSMSFTSVSIDLARDVRELVNSLGGYAKLKEVSTDSTFGKAYHVAIHINLPIFKLKRKLSRMTYQPRRTCVAVESIDITHTMCTQCITVDSPTKSFLAENYVVTHNSVLLGSMFTLYMAYHGSLPGFGKVNFGGYIGNSVRGGVRQNMQTIAGVFKDSDYLQDKFEFTHFTDTAVKFIRHPKKNAKGVITTREKKEGHRTFVMEGYGAQAGPRGSRDGLTRPQFFIIDDVIKNAADSRSDVILGNIRSMIEEDIGYALHGGNSFCIYIGTPFNLRDPLMNALIDGTWTPIVFPIAQKIALDMKKDEFKGSWEDRHSYEKVMTKYRTAVHKGTLAAFMQEQMLRVASEEDRVIKDEMINWFSRKDVIANGHLYNWYITTDFTTTGSKSSDFSAMAVWAVNNNGDYMLIDLVVQKLELSAQYDRLMSLVRQYKKMRGYVEVGIETSGQQKAHIFALKLLMAKHNEYFTVAVQKGKNTEGIMRTTQQGNKFEYFMLIVPEFQNSKIWFAEELKDSADMQELLAELSYVTHMGIGSRSDDALDVVSQLSQLNIRVPQYENPLLPSGKEEDLFDTGNRYWDAEIIDEDEGSSYIF